MTNLGTIYARQGRYEESERILEDALAIYLRVAGEDHPETLGTLHRLAWLRSRQGRFDEAERLYRRSLAGRRRIYGDDHRWTLLTKNALAGMYRDQRRYPEAEPLYREILESRKRVLGDDHVDTLQCMRDLATVCSGQERHDEAAALLQELLRIQREAPSRTDSSITTTLYGLARLDALRGERTAALSRLRELVAAGWTNPRRLMRDEDLASLRGDPEFEALVAELEARARPREDTTTP
jgi:tetratricopeptide (TPR) repeat protein